MFAISDASWATPGRLLVAGGEGRSREVWGLAGRG